MLNRPDFKNHIFVKDAVNKDIRNGLEKSLPIAIREAQTLGPLFKADNERDTARNIWQYLRNRIQYKRDPDTSQDIKLPRRFHHDKNGDCKSYSLNALAIYKAAYPDLPVAFKYTAYDADAKEPTHVYAVVKDRNGKNIVIDGCYNFFDSEKGYTLALPLTWDMQVRILSDNTSANNWYANLHPEDAYEVKQLIAHKAQLELAKQKVASGEMSVNDCHALCDQISDSLNAPKKKRVKKHSAGENALHWLDIATLAIGRGAYDALVAINLNGMADKLMILHAKYPKQWKHVAKIYYELGGYEKALLKAAKIGSKHKPLFLSKKAKSRYEQKFGADSRAMGLKGIADGIGFAPAAAAAAAVPVLAAIIPAIAKAFKEAGAPQHAEEMQSQAVDLVQDAKPGGQLDQNNIALPFAVAPPAPATGTPPIPPADEQPAPSDDFGFSFKDAFGINGIGDMWGDIGGALGSLFHAGMHKLREKLDNNSRTNPALKQLGNAAIDGSSWVAGQGLSILGGEAQAYANKLNPVPDPTKHHPKGGGGNMMPFLLLAGVGLVVLSKNNNPVNGIGYIGKHVKKFLHFKK